MTNKIQKIREEVEKLHGNPYYMMAVKDVLEILDMQEEPVRRTSTDIESAMQEVEEKSKAFTDANKGESAEEILAGMKGIDPSIQDIVDKHWFEMLDEEPILEVLAKYLDHVSKEEAMKTKDAIDRWFAEYFPEPVNKPLVNIEIPFGRDSELLEESIAVPEGCHAVIEGNRVVIRKGEEPVSDELEDAAVKYSQSIHSDYINDMFDSHNIYDAVIYGAQWQKERDEDEIRMIRELLDNFDKTCDEYHDAGFKHGQEALMKDAVEGLVICDELTHYYKDIVMPIPDYLKVGDKVKLIIIKED